MAQPTEMPFGTDIGLRQSHIVLDGDYNTSSEYTFVKFCGLRHNES